MPIRTIDHNKTDEELVSLVLTDEDYYLILMKRYESKLSNYIKKLSNFNNEDIEDILQEVFIKAFRYLNDFDQKMKFSSWIYRIAHNETISHFRKKSSRPKVISVEDNDTYLSQTLPAKHNVESDASKNIESKNIAEVLNKIDRKYKDILILRYFEEKDYKEISDILQKPIGTVGTLLNRAKKSFKDEAKKQGMNFTL